ncbi:MAG: hemerythrin domain-containing protein [Prolixibacteraceae bacterium]|jgi:regulator of cell morphogenesis and NO signaling|nr:hemerythrin domain-containing protein [Prolixibacteraceae bacterium]
MRDSDSIEHALIEADDQLCEVLGRNIDLLPIVFRFGISPNMGQSTLEEICLRHKIDLDFLLAVLNTYNSGNYFPNTDSIDLALLTDFLTKTHLQLKQVTIPLLGSLMQKLKIKLPGSKLTITLERYLNDYISRLMEHIEFEEKYIFPLVGLLNKNGSGSELKTSTSKLKKLFGQHNNVETEISDLIMIILQHIPEDTDIQLFHDILHTLSHFEKEQVDHARFEDKILVPRLLKLFGTKF